METILGYDTNLPLLKFVVFQYKRPYSVNSELDRRFSVNGDPTAVTAATSGGAASCAGAGATAGGGGGVC